MKGTCGVFRVDEGSSSGRGRIKVGTPRDMRRISTHATYNKAKIKVGTPRDIRRISTHATYNEAEIKVGTIIKGEEQRRYYQHWAEQNDYWKREDDHEENHTHSSESPKSKGSASSPRVNDLLSHILDKVEGLDDLLKGMKNDFSSFNSKVNSHADAIKTLEGKLSLLSAQLKPR
uniref:Integrase core domain containing protein n=1 Tax=Solanum tuberosum TaxID=4113 RepID=M1DLW1_SOLTU